MNNLSHQLGSSMYRMLANYIIVFVVCALVAGCAVVRLPGYLQPEEWTIDAELLAKFEGLEERVAALENRDASQSFGDTPANGPQPLRAEETISLMLWADGSDSPVLFDITDGAIAKDYQQFVDRSDLINGTYSIEMVLLAGDSDDDYRLYNFDTDLPGLSGEYTWQESPSANRGVWTRDETDTFPILGIPFKISEVDTVESQSTPGTNLEDALHALFMESSGELFTEASGIRRLLLSEEEKGEKRYALIVIPPSDGAFDSGCDGFGDAPCNWLCQRIKNLLCREAE